MLVLRLLAECCRHCNVAPLSRALPEESESRFPTTDVCRYSNLLARRRKTRITLVSIPTRFRRPLSQRTQLAALPHRRPLSADRYTTGKHLNVEPRTRGPSPTTSTIVPVYDADHSHQPSSCRANDIPEKPPVYFHEVSGHSTLPHPILLSICKKFRLLLPTVPQTFPLQSSTLLPLDPPLVLLAISPYSSVLLAPCSRRTLVSSPP